MMGLNWTGDAARAHCSRTHSSNSAMPRKVRRGETPIWSARRKFARVYQNRGLDAVIAQQITFLEAMTQGKMMVTGNPMKLDELMALMDEFPRSFEIVEPKRDMVT